jgi:hypothetical protein
MYTGFGLKGVVEKRKINFKHRSGSYLIALTLQRALCGRLAPLLGMGLDLRVNG